LSIFMPIVNSFNIFFFDHKKQKELGLL